MLFALAAASHTLAFLLCFPRLGDGLGLSNPVLTDGCGQWTRLGTRGVVGRALGFVSDSVRTCIRSGMSHFECLRTAPFDCMPRTRHLSEALCLLVESTWTLEEKKLQSGEPGPYRSPRHDLSSLDSWQGWRTTPATPLRKGSGRADRRGSSRVRSQTPSLFASQWNAPSRRCPSIRPGRGGVRLGPKISSSGTVNIRQRDGASAHLSSNPISCAAEDSDMAVFPVTHPHRRFYSTSQRTVGQHNSTCEANRALARAEELRTTWQKKKPSQR